MLKYTKPSVIAFDFKDALSFEGETGPYVQYAVVRASNIFRKGGFNPETFRRTGEPRLDAGLSQRSRRATKSGNSGLRPRRRRMSSSQCIATTEPAYLAKHAFQMAQLFNTFYHRHPILAEADEGRKNFLLATAAVVRRELIRVLASDGNQRSKRDVSS